MKWHSLLSLLAVASSLSAEEPLPGTPLLDPPKTPEERSTDMVAGIGRWLHHESERVTADRHARWEAAAKSEKWEEFAEKKRAELRALLGLEKSRVEPHLEKLEDGRVRWPVLEGVAGEGIFRPGSDDALPTVIVVPEADELPEKSSLAVRLLGFPTLVLTTVGRGHEYAGKDGLKVTTQTNREWLYRQSFELGRTLLGYEVQKVLAAADTFTSPVILAGQGEGSIVALHAAALDPRFAAVLLGGGLASHAGYEKEPIDRNLFGARRDFGDAELAALSAAPILVEKDQSPLANERELALALQYRPGHLAQVKDGSSELMERFWPRGRSWNISRGFSTEPAFPALPQHRQRRTVRELEHFTQDLLPQAERQRNADVWAKIGTSEWPAARAALQGRLWASIGQLPGDRLPPNPRTRRVLEAPKWTAYEVMIDVVPDVFAWGWLLVPKDLQPGERRPVVVCQHGLEGLPGDTVTEDPAAPGFKFYQGFAARLAEEGFVTYAPHNPYRGGDDFRLLQRQANPLGLSLFSFIIAQHEVTTDWLASLPFVDPARIGFYGLSYGGKSAMRIPALVDRYALSICSGDFNEWIRKVASVDVPMSYMFTKEWEIFEWNLAWNANYAEMAMLIAPRPFMVERGHRDGVGSDEMVGYEYAKVQRGYVRLGVPERTAIEWFDGPHMIHGVGTFAFLRKWLGPVRR